MNPRNETSHRARVAGGKAVLNSGMQFDAQIKAFHVPVQPGDARRPYYSKITQRMIERTGGASMYDGLDTVEMYADPVQFGRGLVAVTDCMAEYTGPDDAADLSLDCVQGLVAITRPGVLITPLARAMGADWFEANGVSFEPAPAPRPYREITAAVRAARHQQYLNETASMPTSSAPTIETAWPEPQPLSVRMHPQPYPLDAMPDIIRQAIEEVGGFVKAPKPMVASSALAALSLAIQPHADVMRADKLHGPASLFMLTIADSGERKSTCDGFFTKAIREFETVQALAAKPILKDYKTAVEIWDAKRLGIKEKIRQLAKEGKPTASMETALRDVEHSQPQAPRIPRLIYSDATPEALAFGLATQWPSAGVVSAEAGIVLGGHAMSRDSAMRNLAMLNQLWDGNSLTIDRRTSESFTVRGARLTVALQVQEPTLREFFIKSGTLARGTGFLARFLVAWPESTQGFRPFSEAPESWPNLAAFNKRIAEILEQPVPIDDEGALTPEMLTLTPEAKATWIEYHNSIETQLASGGDLYDVRDVASKTADNAVRLAALFHVFCSTNSTNSSSKVGVAHLNAAARIATWHLNESRRFFGELALPAELADAMRLDTWLSTHHPESVAKNHVRQHGPLRDTARLDAAIRELASLDRLRLVKIGKQTVIHRNPGC